MASQNLVDYTARPLRALGGYKLFWNIVQYARLTRRPLGLQSFDAQDSSVRLTGFSLSLPRVVDPFFSPAISHRLHIQRKGAHASLIFHTMNLQCTWNVKVGRPFSDLLTSTLR